MNTNPFYLTYYPSGVELIQGEKMPVKPLYCDHVKHSHYYWQARRYERLTKNYEAALERAKAEAVTVVNEEKAVSLIAHGQTILDVAKAKAHYCKIGEVYGPFTSGYEIRENTDFSYEYETVAILSDTQQEKEESQEERLKRVLRDRHKAIKGAEKDAYLNSLPVERKEFLELKQMVIDLQRELKKAKEQFTITRK